MTVDRSGTYYGRIADGKIELENRNGFAALIKRLAGKDIEIQLRRRRRSRSLSQNAYYWGVVIALLVEHTGYDNEEMHDCLKLRFLTDHETNPELPRVRSTSSLNTKEFAEYLDKCILLGMELGVIIPDPPSAIEAEKNAPRRLAA